MATLADPSIALDSATLYGVMHATTYRKPSDWPDWTLRCALSATSLFLKRQKILIPPAPKKPQYSGLSTTLFGELNGSIADPQAPIEVKKEVIDYTNSLVLNSKQEWKDRFEDLKNEESCEPWLDRAITHFWEELTVLQDGIYDRDFIHAISILTNIDEKELISLHNQTRDKKKVHEWSRNQRGDDFEIIKNAYMATNLLRGTYYNHLLVDVNLSSGNQLHSLFHPLRIHSLPEKSFDDYEIQNTNTEVGLVSLISSSLLIGRSSEDRIKRWTANLRRARNAIYRHDLGLDHCKNTDAVIDRVYLIAKKGNLDLLPDNVKKIGQLITEILGASGGATAGLFIAGPIGAVVGAGVGLAGDKLGDHLREKVLFEAARNKRRIKKLWDEINDIPASRIIMPRKY
jgi:hypothetical protein